ncbi:ectoine/hydroxyectoine ABC transporter substrate-binding protein EhuB [Pseudogemmobacter sonorensis]|uniref:ectoine/hydroxyectoine ABC transporter substrate-binding protein EhuB n=1 Tax=Pseudogemmobacter sonorensis TaxID=2989681 RepID=UPI00369FD517
MKNLTSLALAALGAIGVPVAPVLAQDLLERVTSGATIAVGTANEAPFSSINASGALEGSDIALLEAILAQMGPAQTEGSLTEFGALIPGLLASRFDIIAAGLYISPERCQQVAFAEPVFAIGNTFIVPAGNPKNLHSFEDLINDPSLKAGHTMGSRLRTTAIEAGVPEDQLTPFPDGPALIAAVKAGRVDAVLFPALSAQTLLDKANDPAVERAIPFHDPIINGKPAVSYGSFAFRKEDAAFVEAFNAILVPFVQSEEYAEMVRPFGFTAEDLPVDVTTASICAG